MKYIVTKEIKSEVQLVSFVYFQDVLFVVAWGGMTFLLKEQVHNSLQNLYLFFSLGVGIRLVLKESGNPNRRFFQTLAIYMSRPKQIFRFYKESQDEERGGKTHQKRNTYQNI